MNWDLIEDTQNEHCKIWECTVTLSTSKARVWNLHTLLTLLANNLLLLWVLKNAFTHRKLCDMAAKILPVVRRQHLLLCTLLICNAAAMEVTIAALTNHPEQIHVFVLSTHKYLCICYLNSSGTSHLSRQFGNRMGCYPSFSNLDTFIWWG